MAKLHDYYKDEVVKKLMTEFNYNSVMQVPRGREDHPEHGCW
ncbi:50S ribosomal protein L5 [Klebsiella pneumoniae]|uniref:50S ribosomal protein L5 n=1 Tax=Klebsiella pneumoniae TaxID=573 RepID=A0A377U5V4_KLEPN|nr:50S ribosomal protein L5 [Klebsiella pneumoniae]